MQLKSVALGLAENGLDQTVLTFLTTSNAQRAASFVKDVPDKEAGPEYLKKVQGGVDPRFSRCIQRAI